MRETKQNIMKQKPHTIYKRGSLSGRVKMFLSEAVSSLLDTEERLVGRRIGSRSFTGVIKVLHKTVSTFHKNAMVLQETYRPETIVYFGWD